MYLVGKHIGILGASSGLGRGIAALCSEKGAKVSLFARREKELDETARYCTGGSQRIHIAPVDATDGMKLEAAIDGAIEHLGAFDGFVHSVGLSSVSPIQLLEPWDIEALMAINFTTAMTLAKIFTARRRYRDSLSHVWLSSIQEDRVAGKGCSAYAATKGAMSAAARALAFELAPRKIRINTLKIGMVETPMWDQNPLTEEQRTALAKRHPLGVGTVDDVARLVVFLLSDWSKWITGASIPIDGGMSCHNSP